MHFQLVAILVLGVCFYSEAARINTTQSSNTRTNEFSNQYFGPSYRPKWYDPSSVVTRSGDNHFGYDPPHGSETWPDSFPECGGDRQSPINLQTKDFDPRLSREPLSFINYDVLANTLEFENSGHSMHLSGDWDDADSVPSIKGGPLGNGEYSFSQLHFHWGRENSRGSEHTINHKRYPCEMHVVHARRGEVSVDPFEEVPDDIAVVGYVCKIEERDNPALRPLLEACRRIRQPGTKAKITPFAIANLLTEFDSQYVTYEGSLTTPPCSETVKWIVSSESIKLSNSQMQELRTCIRDENGRTMQNYRAIQKVNDRSVYYLQL